MNSCTIRGKPLVLPWGRTSRLDSGVRTVASWSGLSFDSLCVVIVLLGLGPFMSYFRINITQLSVIGVAKVSHFEILCRVYGVTPTVGLFMLLKRMDGCLSSSVLIDLPDPALVATDFNVQDYATLVVHPSPFRKFPEEFLCLVGLSRHYTLDEETYPLFLDKDGEDMDIFAFIYTSDPTKSEQGDFASGGGEQCMNIQPVTETTDVVVEDVIPLQPRRLKKRKTIVAEAGGPSYPLKKLKEDHETPSGVFVGGKFMSAVQRLFAGAVQNAEVRGEPIQTMSFMTSSISATPEREGECHTDS
nr:hypothetical protein [Tanacetum cinerariifolium]